MKMKAHFEYRNAIGYACGTVIDTKGKIHFVVDILRVFKKAKAGGQLRDVVFTIKW